MPDVVSFVLNKLPTVCDLFFTDFGLHVRRGGRNQSYKVLSMSVKSFFVRGRILTTPIGM